MMWSWSRKIVRLFTFVVFVPFLSSIFSTSPAVAQDAAKPGNSVAGQFFSIEEPINSDVLSRMKSASKQVLFKYGKTDSPVLVFEFRPGRTQPGSSEIGASYELADFLSTELGGATVVAYVPEPLKGYAVLPVLACDEIVMGPNASLGPITPEGKTVNAAYNDPIRFLAKRKGRDADLFLGMLDRNADLRAVRTADKQLHYVMAGDLDEFKKSNQVIDQHRAWDGGAPGVFTARRAREEGFVKLLVENRGDIANAYRLKSSSQSNDPTLFQDPKPVWIQLDGLIDSKMRNYVTTRLERARTDGANLIFLAIRSDGGVDTEASNIAQLLSELKDIKTVAYVDDRAMGVASMVVVACDDIVLQKGSKVGDLSKLRTSRGSNIPLTETQVATISDRIEALARQKGHPPAIARAMVDRSAVVLEAKDATTGATVFVLQSQVDADKARYLDPKRRKDSGEVLTLTANEAAGFGLGRVVSDEEEFKGLYQLRGKTIRVEGPTWVDGVVTTLNEPFVSGLLLFIGIFMLILEVKMPGVGLPAIISVVAFVLFFWSRFLSGTADQLEILLFVVGLVCLLLELFVFPGFGVFGFSGVVLILVSIVMASHTFVWPSQEYEYRQMASTLMQMLGAMVFVGFAVTIVGRYLPSIPIFNRLVLKPESSSETEFDELTGKPVLDDAISYTYLMGETGRATTALRPTGKAKFGDQLIDVLADGVYIEPGNLVEVVEIRGPIVVVRPMR